MIDLHKLADRLEAAVETEQEMHPAIRAVGMIQVCEQVATTLRAIAKEKGND